MTWRRAPPADPTPAGREDEQRMVRVVMNLLTSNVFLGEVVGGIGALPWVGAWAQIILV